MPLEFIEEFWEGAKMVNATSQKTCL